MHKNVAGNVPVVMAKVFESMKEATSMLNHFLRDQRMMLKGLEPIQKFWLSLQGFLHILEML